MPILSVIYGKDQKNAINVTDVILEKYTKDDILYIPNTVNFNDLKYDPYPGEQKRLYIVYCVGNIASTTEFDENRFYDITINTNYEHYNDKSYTNEKNKNIIIYPHLPYHEDDGGLNVMYNFAKILDELGYNTRIYPTYGYIKNSVYNKYFVLDFFIEKSTVIYCEGTEGNPLNSIRPIRWMLSELGNNVNNDMIFRFGRKELVYFFNNEKMIDENREQFGSIYKMLSLLYINPIYKNINIFRDIEYAFTIRKTSHRKSITKIHPDNAIEITRGLNHEQLANIFNRTQYFISYDPLTFLSILSAICGCISIICPLENKTKQEWLSLTAIKEYINYKKIDNLYGIAYGMEDIEWAKNTIHLVPEQWNDIIEYYKKNHINSFLNDIENYSQQKNTIENVFFKNKNKKTNYYLEKFSDISSKLYAYKIVNNPFEDSELYPQYIKNTEYDYDVFEYYEKYFEENIKNNIWYNNQRKHYFWDLNIHKKYFFFIKNCIKNKRVSICSPYTKNEIHSDKYFLKRIHINTDTILTVVNYYFEEEDIILGINLGTGTDIMYSRIAYLISFENSEIIHFNYSYGEQLKNITQEYLSEIIKNKNEILKNKECSQKESKIITLFGYNNNMGHFLMNEMTGLYILKTTNILQYITDVYIGNNTLFDISHAFYDNTKTTVNRMENIEESFGKGIIFKYCHFFISNECNKFIMDIIQNSNNVENSLPVINYYPIINITLREGSRSMINQEENISYLINKINEKYPNAYFLFDGYCKCDYSNTNSNIEIKNKYENLVENICKKSILYTTPEKYTSLINKPISEIIHYLNQANYSFYSLGTGATIGVWLCNLKGIQYGKKGCNEYKDMDFLIKEDMPDIIYLDESNSNIKFVDDNDNSNYIIYMNELYNIFSEKFS